MAAEGPGTADPRRARPLLRSLLHPVRLLLTALAFVVFGAGGIGFGILVTPRLALSRAPERERRRRARAVIRRWFGFFVRFITALGLTRIVVRNPEALSRPGAILCANHPSLIDVVCLLSVVPEATTVVKSSLLRNWFTRWPIRAAGYVPNDAGPDALPMLEAELGGGSVFIIFPEGTRTPSVVTEIPKLHRGSAQLALHTRRPITPVRISANPRWLTKDCAWWRLPERPMTLTFEALPEIPVEPYLDLYNQSPRKAAMRYTEALGRALFDAAPESAAAREAGPAERTVQPH